MRIPSFIINTLLVAGSFLPLVLLNSCDTAGVGGNEEGVIEFDTKGVDPTHPLYGFAPDKATMKYKKDKFAIEMSTMGMFNINVIADNKKKTMVQSIKFMNIKQACIEHEKELDEENLDFALSIQETGDTKEIIGLKSYKVKVTKVNDPTVTFDAWYTKELGMENCNALTPYSSVKGVLLDYRIKKLGMEMHFLAKNIKHEPVPDHTFEIPATMKIVSKQEMEKFIMDLQ